MATRFMDPHGGHRPSGKRPQNQSQDAEVIEAIPGRVYTSHRVVEYLGSVSDPCQCNQPGARGRDLTPRERSCYEAALDCLRTFVTGEADMGCPPIAAEIEEYEELNMGSSRFMCIDTHLVGAFMDELSDGDVLRMISAAEDLAR